MILTAIVCIACAAGGFSVRDAVPRLIKRRRKKLAPTPVNQFGVAILPDVDDPRWEKSGQNCNSKDTCIRYQMAMGKIKTCPDHGVWIDGVPILNYRTETDGEMRQRKYAWDVRRAYQARLAMEAIDGPPRELSAVED